MADRLERQAKGQGIEAEPSKSTARAQELGMAALLVREEAVAVGREEGETSEEEVAESLSPKAQGVPRVTREPSSDGYETTRRAVVTGNPLEQTDRGPESTL